MFLWISQLLRDKPEQATSRPITAIGRDVQAHYGCGYAKGKQLIFSAEDKRLLRQRVLAEIGLDPFKTEQLPESRLQMAQYHADEKLAANPAGDDHLLLNSADGIIRVNGVEIPLHPQSLTSAGLLSLNAGIETLQHQTIVVVENLVIMPLCHRWHIPCVDPDALWVYRGDAKTGAKATACRDFVERFGADRSVVVFSDMDPKGLEIALTMPQADYWLGPAQAVWRDCLQSQLANREGFDSQAGALAYLQSLADNGQLSAEFNQLLACLKQARSSFRQEHMFARSLELVLCAMTLRGKE